jgi:hypothetical protein
MMLNDEIDWNVDQKKFNLRGSKSQPAEDKTKSDNWKLKRRNFETIRQISQIKIDQME